MLSPYLIQEHLLQIVLNMSKTLTVESFLLKTESGLTTMTEKEYIEREALIKTCEEIIQISWNETTAPVSWSHAYADFIGNIEEQPAADVAPVVHAHWQPDEDTVQCSACGFGTFMDGYFFVHGECTHADDRSFRFSFCPNCGAKMDGKECK